MGLIISGLTIGIGYVVLYWGRYKPPTDIFEEEDQP